MSSPDPPAPQQIPTTTTVSPPGFLQPFITGRGLNSALANADPGGFLPQAFGLSQNSLAALPSAEDRVSPLTAGQVAGANALTGRLGATDAGENFLTSFLGRDPFDTSRFDDVVRSTQGGIVDQFNLNVAPAIAGASRAGGSFGNTGLAEFDNAQRFNLARALGESESGIRLAGINQNIGAGLQAAGLVPALNQASITSANAAITGGEVFRSSDQALRDVRFQNFLDERNEPLRRLGILADAIGVGSGGGNFRSTSGTQFFQPQQSSNPFLTGIGLFGSLAGSAASLATLSSKTFKQVAGPVDDVLDGVSKMDVMRWNYLGDDTAHMGPMAEDFQDLFGVGDGVTITGVDALGVMFAAVQQLTQSVAKLNEKIDDLAVKTV